jgi:hypothetical protein
MATTEQQDRQQQDRQQQQQASASPTPLPLPLSSSLLLLDTLPNEALGLIIKHVCSDLTSILNLATISDTIRIAIYDQKLLHCDHCNIPFFSNNSLSMTINNNDNNAVTPHTKAFSCATCHDKLCGYTLFDYDRRKCKPQCCDGCGKIECQRCLDAHLNKEENVDGYGTENYCENCQDEFEFGMGGC